MKLEKFSVKLMVLCMGSFLLCYVFVQLSDFNSFGSYFQSVGSTYHNITKQMDGFSEDSILNNSVVSKLSTVKLSREILRDSRTEIVLDTVCTDIKFESLDADEIHINYEADGYLDINKDLEIELTDTKIFIQTDQTRKVNDSINCTGENKIVVGYPKDIQKLTANSVSGDIITPNFQMQTGSFITVSGDLVLKNMKVTDLSLQTTSGDIEASGNIIKADIKTVSGDLVINNSEVSPNLMFQSVSGDILLRLPDSINSTFDFNSVSGDVFIDEVFSNVTTAKAGLHLKLGEGKGQVKAKTVSGDFKLTPLK